MSPAEHIHGPPFDRLIKLRAGPLSAVFEPETAFLRYVRLADREVLRAVYVAVREVDWATAPSRVVKIDLRQESNRFHLQFDVECIHDEIDFIWTAEVIGEATGSLDFKVTGSARTTFMQNRIGICVLHPIRECAGRRCWVELADGLIDYSRFPDDIEPWKPFSSFCAISHEVQTGVLATVRFSGDVFELEDQRNWTDASFKSYTIRPGQEEPLPMKAGATLEQSVRLSFTGELPKMQRLPVAADTPTTIEIVEGDESPLPRIGFGAAGHGRPLDSRAAGLLRALEPAHLRIQIIPSQTDYVDALTRAAADASAIGADIEAAIFLTDDFERELESVVDEMRLLGPAVCSWILFRVDRRQISAAMARFARAILSENDMDARVGAGSNEHFCQIIRGMPPVFDLDVLCHPVNPQMHTSDDASFVETLEAQGWTVENARRIAWRRTVTVSPVTLIRRHRLFSDAGREHDENRRRAQSDPRQTTLFGAAWTAGSIKYLSETGADRITYHETTGWAGVMEGGSREDTAGANATVYPMYHVFADVATYAGGTVLKSVSNSPLTVDAIALRRGHRLGLIAANFTPEERSAVIVSPIGVRGAWLRMLDAGTEEIAAKSPQAFREKHREHFTSVKSRIELRLKPHAVAYLEGEIR